MADNIVSATSSFYSIPLLMLLLCYYYYFFIVAARAYREVYNNTWRGSMTAAVYSGPDDGGSGDGVV